MVFLLMTERETSRRVLINPTSVKTIRAVFVEKIEVGSIMEFKDKTKLEVEELFDEIAGSIDSDYGPSSLS